MAIVVLQYKVQLWNLFLNIDHATPTFAFTVRKLKKLSNWYTRKEKTYHFFGVPAWFFHFSNQSNFIYPFYFDFITVQSAILLFTELLHSIAQSREERFPLPPTRRRLDITAFKVSFHRIDIDIALLFLHEIGYFHVLLLVKNKGSF